MSDNENSDALNFASARLKKYINRIEQMKNAFFGFGGNNKALVAQNFKSSNISVSVEQNSFSGRNMHRILKSEKNSPIVRQTKKNPSLLTKLPVEIMLQICDLLTPMDWKNLETSCQHLREMMITKYADVVELDVYEDYISLKLKKKNREKERNFNELVDYIGNRFFKLEDLILSGCNLELNCPTMLSDLGAALPNLKHLELMNEWPKHSGPVVRKCALNGLNKNFAKLETLVLDGSVRKSCQDKKQFHISGNALPNLKELSMRSCNVSLNFLQHEDAPYQLIALDVENCNSFHPLPHLIHFASTCQNLTEINVSGLGVFNEEALNLFMNLLRLSNLRVLEMGHYVDIVSVVPYNVQVQCPNLEAFLVPNAHFVHYNLLQIVCQSCPKLVAVNLADLNYFDEEKFHVLASCENLVDINLAGTMISDDSIEFLTIKMPQMTELSLRDCKRLTDESIYSLTRNSKKLSKLYLFKKTRTISTNSIQHLINNCHTLRFLEVTPGIIKRLYVPAYSPLKLSCNPYLYA